MIIPDFLFGVLPKSDIVYDEETFPNVFTIGFKCRMTKRRWGFELSFRRNDIYMLFLFIDTLRRLQCRMIGYNNIGFDYPVLHFIYQSGEWVGVGDIYNKAMSIINAPYNAKYGFMVWESDWLVEQVDLFKIHHFDNENKYTSLKALEFNMRMDSVDDSPFPVGTELTSDQTDVLIEYMWHDIEATDLFCDRTQIHIKMREDLSASFKKNMVNMSDIKIGETILIRELESHGIKCYERIGNKKYKIQTIRESIDLSEVVFDYIKFERTEFTNIRNYFTSKVITETKGVFKGLVATLNGFDFVFGTGGLHASVDDRIYQTDETYQIVDIDVASYYPNLGIKNRMYPAHYGTEFCDAYEGIFKTRKTFDKGTVMDKAYKEALVGAYGNSNQEHSPLFDRKYTMMITINGQLLLCMLAEQLIKIPGLQMIQANTDGVTFYCPKIYLDHARVVCKWWESFTQLTLEEVLYSRMFIRDVNSYIAEKEGGKLKRIGAYAYETAEENPGTRELPYHKDWSYRVVAKAAEAALVRGADIREFIQNHDDIFDFFIKIKVPRSTRLEWGGTQVANIIRCYVSTNGDTLEKVMPEAGPAGANKRANKLTDEYYNSVIMELTGKHPLFDDIDWLNVPWDERINTKNRSRYEERRNGLMTGWTVQLANRLHSRNKADYHDINYDWYVKEAEKLVRPLLTTR